jgi:hypothetical protein
MSGTLTLSPARPAQASPAWADAFASPLLRTMMVWVLYAIPIVVAVRPVGDPVFDPDIWWHLRVGQWVAEHQAVPVNDPFSLPGQNQRWVAYSWLYELLLYALHGACGLAGVVIYRAAFSLAVVAAIHALVCRLEKRFLVATGLTAAATFSVAMLFNERPWLVTILFTTLTLHAIVALRQVDDPPLWIWILPILFIPWANTHIQFVYGLFLLGLACVAPLLDAHLGREADDTAASPWTRRWYLLVALSAACFLTTLVNPWHFGLYGVVIEYATQPGPFRYVNELKALEFREPSAWMMLALTGLACWSLGRRRPSAFEVLLLISTGFLAFRARRDLWFVVLADLVILASSGPGIVPDSQRFPLTWRRWGVVALGLAGLIALCAWIQDLSPSGLSRRVAKVFPVEAARLVAERGYPGPLYNDFNWGGYLIGSLPHLPVSIDGRTNLHGDERIERFGRTWAGISGWQDDPDLIAAGVVLAPVDSALASLLLRDQRFKEVHRDELALVFVPRR